MIILKLKLNYWIIIMKQIVGLNHLETIKIFYQRCLIQCNAKNELKTKNYKKCKEKCKIDFISNINKLINKNFNS